jgi:uncharacterized membrane protein (DUF373 family)
MKKEHIEKRVGKSEGETQEYWSVMTIYERFEQVVVLALSAVITVIIIFALWRLVYEVFTQLILEALNPLEYSVFTKLFGMIMTLLIAMEFKHSIIKVVLRREHIIQVKTVILIAQLALARKFIILDLHSYDALQVFALGFAVLVLSIANWLLRERDSAESGNTVM